MSGESTSLRQWFLQDTQLDFRRDERATATLRLPVEFRRQRIKTREQHSYLSMKAEPSFKSQDTDIHST